MIGVAFPMGVSSVAGGDETGHAERRMEDPSRVGTPTIEAHDRWTAPAIRQPAR
jgi:hypothetical protein